MQSSSQPSLFEDLPLLIEQDEKKFKQSITDEILNYLENAHQPAAGKLLDYLEKQFGWKVRHLFLSIIRLMRQDHNIQGYLREYLSTTLADEAIREALRGNAKPNQEYRSTFEDLVQQSVQYRKSAAFKEMIEFVAKFRDYAPYNNMLIKVQNPSCGFYATARDWRDRFKREVKEDARPMLILAPMCPVMLVYDLDSTEGPPLPAKIRTPGKAHGDFDQRSLQYTLENADRDKILVQFKNLSSTNAGFATTRLRNQKYKMRIAIHDDLDERSRYAILCHELAHIYLGHLGTDRDNWWPCRLNLTHRTVEIEAEAVAYIVTIRAGLRPSSAEYLSSYMTDQGIPQSVSLELIGKVAGRLEAMGMMKMPIRKGAKERNVKT